MALWNTVMNIGIQCKVRNLLIGSVTLSLSEKVINKGRESDQSQNNRTKLFNYLMPKPSSGTRIL